MKNKFAGIVVFSILLTVSLGCSFFNRDQKVNSGPDNANISITKDKTLTDEAVDTVVGEEKIGVQECDEVMDFFTAEANNPDDDFVTKAVKATVLNKMKENFKKSIEEGKTDKVELAKTCREFKANLNKYKAEQESKTP